MKKLLSMLLLGLALVATVASASDDESSSGGDSSPTTASSGDDATTTAGGGGAADPGEGDEVDDVVITACAKDDTLGFAEATVEVTNNSSKASSYMIEIAFESEDGSTQVGTGSAFVTGLAAGQKKVEEVTSFEEPGDQPFTCKVSSVDRLAA